MNLFPGLSLRASEDAEIQGIDEAELGEFAYDFVEKERDYVHLPDPLEGELTPSMGSVASRGNDVVNKEADRKNI